MKLDATDLRYISSDEFRVLTAASSRFLELFLPCLTCVGVGGNGLEKP